MTEPAPAACAADHAGCITCGDEGIPMRVSALLDGNAVCVDAAGASHRVAVDLIANVAVGENVIVHAGVAIGTAQ